MPNHRSSRVGHVETAPMLGPDLARWDLTPDGDPIVTPSARLLPVLWRGEPAMLRLSRAEDERLGGALMDWWDGQDAARVFARTDGALLMERAVGTDALATLASTGRDDEACRILCGTAARLHAPRSRPAPPLPPLRQWFLDLEPAAAREGGLLARCAGTARALLSEPREVTVLHGDLHHGNVLNFGPRGWLAIDPKGLVGERGFDFASLFTNPDLADPSRSVATDPVRFARRLAVIAATTRLERRRLLHWILAGSGLSAAWFLADDDPSAAIALAVAELAAAELDRG